MDLSDSKSSLRVSASFARDSSSWRKNNPHEKPGRLGVLADVGQDLLHDAINNRLGVEGKFASKLSSFTFQRMSGGFLANSPSIWRKAPVSPRSSRLPGLRSKYRRRTLSRTPSMKGCMTSMSSASFFCSGVRPRSRARNCSLMVRRAWPSSSCSSAARRRVPFPERPGAGKKGGGSALRIS